MMPEAMARAVFDEATRLSASAAEIFVRAGRGTETRVQDGRPESLVADDFAHVGVRVFTGRKWGLAWTTDPDAEALRRLVRDALALAGVSPDDPSARLAESLDVPPDRSYADPAFASLRRSDRIATALRIEEAGKRTSKRIRSSRYVAFTDVRESVFLANTRGLQAGYETTQGALSCMFGAERDGVGQQLFGSAASRRLSDLDPARLGASTARRLHVTVGGVSLPTGRRDVVLDASQTASLLARLAPALNGDQVHLGRSYLRDRVGERVASDRWTLRDDPGRDAGGRSYPFDDEGVGARPKTLIDAGVLRGFLYDTTSAGKAGTVSTGNGLRRTVDQPPAPSPSVLVLDPGGSGLEALTGEVERGVYVTGFMGGGLDPVSGTVSMAVLGAEIRNGSLAGPVAGVTLTGTMDEILQAVDATGDALEGGAGLLAPALRMRDVLIVGAQT